MTEDLLTSPLRGSTACERSERWKRCLSLFQPYPSSMWSGSLLKDADSWGIRRWPSCDKGSPSFWELSNHIYWAPPPEHQPSSLAGQWTPSLEKHRSTCSPLKYFWRHKFDSEILKLASSRAADGQRALRCHTKGTASHALPDEHRSSSYINFPFSFNYFKNEVGSRFSYCFIYPWVTPSISFYSESPEG